MKTHTKIFCGTVFAALLLSAPMIADARPFGHGYGPGNCYGGGPGGYGGGWYQTIPENSRGAFQTMMQEHRAKVQPIHDQLWTKETTLRALKDNPNVKPTELTALIDEMAALRTQLRNEHNAFAARIKKDVGVDLPFGCGMQGAGFGSHRGPGGRHGGFHGGKGMYGYHGGRGM